MNSSKNFYSAIKHIKYVFYRNKTWCHRRKGSTVFQENIKKLWLMLKNGKDSIVNAVQKCSGSLIYRNPHFILANWFGSEIWQLDNSLLIYILEPLESDQHPGIFITNFWGGKNEVILNGFKWLRGYSYVPTLVLVVIAVLTYVKICSVSKLLYCNCLGKLIRAS